ncbi:MAG: PorP/SprF family type IX secretion system membrane protein [Bacteroidetes bacterium]|nr:PorP/SprF family type IX secretion system membrane protein [Bacteroidota bacterium]
MLSAQYPEFSQFFANPLYLNPAMAGTSEKSENAAGRASLNYRLKWPTLSGGFRTSCASWDQGYDKLHGGIGVQYVNEITPNNILSKNEIHGIYSFRFQFGDSSKNIFYSGIQVSASNWNWEYLQYNSNNPSKNPPIPVKEFILVPNTSIGFLMCYPKFNFGAAIHNLFEPSVSITYPEIIIDRKYTLHWGYQFQLLHAKWDIQPQACYIKQGKSSQLQFGGIFNYKFLQGGIWMRQVFQVNHELDAAIFHVGIQNNNYRILYSYDKQISDGIISKYVSHEVSLAYRWKTKQKKYRGNNLIF